MFSAFSDFLTIGMVLHGDLDSLKLVLKHCPDVSLKQEAIHRIRDAPNHEVTFSLLKLVQDRQTDISLSAIDELGRRKCREAIPRLVDLIKTCRGEATFRQSAEALCQIGASEAVVPLSDFIKNPRPLKPLKFFQLKRKDRKRRKPNRIDREDRLKEFVKILGEFGEPAVEELIFLSKSDKKEIQLEAFFALSKIVSSSTRKFWLEYLDTYTPDYRYFTFGALSNHEDPKVYAVMERSLRDETDDSILIEAAKYLTSKGHADARALLLANLENEKESIRDKAIDACGELGLVEAIPILRALVNDFGNESREAARDALARLGSPGISPLLETLNDEDAALLEVDVLVEFIDRMPPEGVLEALAKTLSSPNKLIRITALRAMVHLRDEKPEEYIHTLLKDSDSDVRGEAIQCLGLLNAKTGFRDIMAFLNDPSIFLATRAIKALGNMGAKEAAPAVAEQLAKHDPRIVCAVVETLGKLKAEDYIGGIQTIMRTAERYVARFPAEIPQDRLRGPLKKYVEQEAEIVTKPLSRFMGTSEEALFNASLGKIDAEDIQWKCLEALKKMGKGFPIDWIIQRIDDPSTPFFTRESLISLIADVGNARTIPCLVRAVKEPASWLGTFYLGKLRIPTLEALFLHEYPDGYDAFLALLDDEDPEIKAMALTKLAEYRDERAILAISARMPSYKWRLRSLAVWSIGEIGGRWAIKALEKYRFDRSVYVRELAKSKLSALESLLVS